MKLVRDPVCGMDVNEKTAIRRVVAGRTYYFCMEACARAFEQPEKELRALKRRVVVALGGVLAVAVLRVIAFFLLAGSATIVTWAPLPALPWFTWGMWLFIITTPVQFIGGWSFYLGAYKALINRRANMDLLITISTLTAYSYSTLVVFFPAVLPVEEKNVYFDVAAVIIAFVLLGRFMEDLIKKRSSAAIRRLMDLKPPVARVIRDGKELEISSDAVVVGDIVLVKPGEKIATDGVVIEGSSAVDEKMLTGESIPVEKKAGDEVFGGTINRFGALKFRVTKVGNQTMLAQIIKIVEEAKPAPIQRYADRLAAYFVPAVVLIAIGTLLFWTFCSSFTYALLAFIAVLIISCPCALGIATPAALMVGTGKGAELGILIRSGETLERAKALDTVVFDKTGTLTVGEPSVTDVITAPNRSDEEVVMLAASAEHKSEHPLASAILKYAHLKGIKYPESEFFAAIPGLGVKAVVMAQRIVVNLAVGNRALMEREKVDISSIASETERLEHEGKTVIFVVRNNKLIGVLGVADTLKPHARETVNELKKLGLEVYMLTGDNSITAKAIARQLGIKRVISNVRPKDKAAVIKALQKKGRVVAMVGDGINDAPALAVADIGIALGSGSDIAKETGNIVLLRDDLRAVVTSIMLSRATMRKIRQNLFWALGYNTASIPIAVTGQLNPIIAAAAMALSSLSVVTNSAVLSKFAVSEKAKLKEGVDPVCKMQVDVNTATLKSVYKGKTYYFCNPMCKKNFDKNPTKYV